ncbi:thiosulfohydrolase SoxB [Neptuniibacter sp. CAU 1671]|uniref:thiosulfohydrolase SoxB n=1 Tax=Neptuniibacter sp. CAU 1671 TaxID=3032593 RepID=UPI0023DB729B|nr:thiosulfohydrolase SoxB [Neptuniibacter sp. CAU 1671]MDF2182779.1 thiosulfohydrolase SoxB [Neptuniibacter sp. CAU 1671]
MSLSRREFAQLIGVAGIAGLLPQRLLGSEHRLHEQYLLPNRGNVRLLHMTDCHAQLLPVYYREPDMNLGVGPATGKPPHLVGNKLLAHFAIPPGSLEAHAFTHLNFAEAAARFGKVGGFAHLKTLVDQLRQSFGAEKTLLLDGGDTWQGSGTAYKTRGKDMVRASNALGVDLMTGHWEFTYHQREVLQNIADFNGEFLAQNVFVTEDALFNSELDYLHDPESGRIFKPYTVRSLGSVRVAVIGQAFPRTRITNPARFIPDWSFDIHAEKLQVLINFLREHEKVDAVVLLSHNGMDVDLKLAAQVTGIDIILGGHTHDALPAPSIVKNRSGQTLVCNAGSNGKFLAVLDLNIAKGRLKGFHYRLLPVFSELLPANPDMDRLIEDIRAPHLPWLQEELAVADRVMFRRGNFNGTFDQLICDAQRTVNDAQIALSPGFRWGTTALKDQMLTMEHVLNQTCLTYPETYVREMTGAELKMVLEDVADNLFNPDPYLQSGGDMVRLGGVDYVCDPTEKMGRRISDLTLDNGEKIEAGKRYKVAGWATVSEQSEGQPIWDLVATYLRDRKSAHITKLNTPKLKGVRNNPGLEDSPA